LKFRNRRKFLENGGFRRGKKGKGIFSYKWGNRNSNSFKENFKRE